MRDDFLEEPIVFPRKPGRRERTPPTSHRNDVAEFLYDIALIVAGIAGAVILLRLAVQGLAS